MGITLEVVNGPSIALQVTRISLHSGAGTGTPGTTDNIKNWGTISGATTLNATSYSTQTADFTASFTATLEGFTTSRQSIAFEFVVASGTPKVTLAGSIFKFYTTLNLSALAAGSYVAYFKSSDSGTNTKVFVKLAP